MSLFGRRFGIIMEMQKTPSQADTEKKTEGVTTGHGAAHAAEGTV
jgi:hypothetical protein